MRIILFDGDCNFCNHAVNFIIKNDLKAVYTFCSIQSENGKKLIQKYHIPTHLDSLLYIENDKWYAKSSAALRICKNLAGIWKLLYILLLFPKPLRDLFYHFIAKNRYRIVSNKAHCIVPSKEVKKRFL